MQNKRGGEEVIAFYKFLESCHVRGADLFSVEIRGKARIPELKFMERRFRMNTRMNFL